MRGEHFYGHTATTKRTGTAKAPRPFQRHGTPEVGHVVRLFVGRGDGFIRLANDHEVYFHRADVEAGTSINDLAIGDAVAFEWLEDRVSGARALRVRRQPAAPRPGLAP